MAFGWAGAGAGAAKGLEEILAQQMIRAQMAQRQKEAAQQAEMEQARLSESSRQFNVRTDADERKRRDGINRDGLDLMQRDKGEMDMEAAVSQLPPHLKQVAGLVKVGALGKLGTDDLQSPEDRANALKADEERQIRIRRASQAPAAPRERKQVWVLRGGQPTPIEEGTAQSGDTPYDPVAARSSQPKDQAEAQDTAREAARLASELLKHKGFGGAFGPISSMMPTLSDDTADAESIRDALTSLLTLENMSKMKGVLSDSDMKVLRQASTTLNGRMSEGGARQELTRIVDVMGRVAAGQTPNAGPLPNGASVTIDPEAAAMALIERARAGRKPGG